MSKMLLVGLIAGSLSLLAPIRFGHAEESRPISKIAYLGEDDSAKATFRSVELKPPWLYALGRDGNLHIFKIPQDRIADFASGLGGVLLSFVRTDLNLLPARSDRPLKFINSIEGAGDGYDLEIIGNVLALTSKGKLAVFALDEPSAPTKIGEFGHESLAGSMSIVGAGKHAFVLGRGNIESFDFTDPSTPKHVATLKNEGWNGNGCYDGRFLYVSEFSRRQKGRTGIAVYDAANPKAVVERHFVPTERSPYHVFVNGDGYLLACFDSKSSWSFRFLVGRHNVTVDGSTQMFELHDNDPPKLAATIKNSGGRAAVLTHHRDDSLLICNGVAFLSKSDELKKNYSFFPTGTTLDGFAYKGDHCGQFAAITADHDVNVFLLGEPHSLMLGKQVASLLVLLAL